MDSQNYDNFNRAQDIIDIGLMQDFFQLFINLFR